MLIKLQNSSASLVLKLEGPKCECVKEVCKKKKKKKNMSIKQDPSLQMKEA